MPNECPNEHRNETPRMPELTGSLGQAESQCRLDGGSAQPGVPNAPDQVRQNGVNLPVSVPVSQTNVPRSEYPRPQLVRDAWLCLNGVWAFAEDPGHSGDQRDMPQGAGFDQEIVVPFAPESPLSGIGKKDFMTCVWYKRNFTVPESWRGGRVLLHFGAVDYDATVWVNGKKLANRPDPFGGRTPHWHQAWDYFGRPETHRGGYTPFTLDVTDVIDRSAPNLLVVRAIDDHRTGLQPSGKQNFLYSAGDTSRCHYTRTTGIWQTVWLEHVPEYYIDHLRLTPNLEQGELRVDAIVTGPHPGTGPARGRLKAVAKAEGAVVAEAEAPAGAPCTSLTLRIPNPRPWEPGDPFLYDLELTLESEAGVDRVTSYFGMRSIRLANGCLYLNGKPIFQRLVLDQGFYPDGVYTAPTDEALRRDIELSMAAGFNGARLHEKVFEPRFLYWADKLGYLVWGEFPNWGLNHGHPEALGRVLTEWLEVLKRDYNHPCIITWCPFNETPATQDPELLRLIYRVTKAVDPTRPVVDTSGWIHVETDVYTSHNYTQSVEDFAAAYAPLARGEVGFRNERGPNNINMPHLPGQPYLVDEYGGIWWDPEQSHDRGWGYGNRPATAEEFLARLEGLTDALLNNPYVCGFCYTQLTDVEQEVNGLYTFDRRPKFDPAIYRRIFSKPAAIEARLKER